MDIEALNKKDGSWKKVLRFNFQITKPLLFVSVATLTSCGNMLHLQVQDFYRTILVELTGLHLHQGAADANTRQSFLPITAKLQSCNSEVNNFCSQSRF